MNRKITAFDFDHYPGFLRAMKKLPAEVRDQARETLKKLLKDPQPASIRLEKLSGYKRPDIYTTHATKNHSHKISFELKGECAVMRRIDTHKKIDQGP
ncbi:MAG: type II toxin-antitoxin system RelE family toxin [Pseudomonadota bacterium]